MARKLKALIGKFTQRHHDAQVLTAAFDSVAIELSYGPDMVLSMGSMLDLSELGHTAWKKQ